MNHDYEAIAAKIEDLWEVLEARIELSRQLADPHLDDLKRAEEAMIDLWRSIGNWDLNFEADKLPVNVGDMRDGVQG